MKVSTIGSKSKISSSSTITSKDKAEKSQSFSSSLNNANREQVEKQLSEMLKNIEKIGKRLLHAPSVRDVREYKSQVKEYLKYAVSNMYIIQKDYGPYSNYIQIKIEVIDKKLEELTENLMKDQKDNIAIANSIEELKGLMVDIFK